MRYLALTLLLAVGPGVAADRPADNPVERGLQKAGKAIERGIKAGGRGAERGARAVSKGAEKVHDKVDEKVRPSKK